VEEGGRAGRRKRWMYVFGGNTLTNSFKDVWRLELEEGWMEEGGGKGGREGGWRGGRRWMWWGQRYGGREGGRGGGERSSGRICMKV